MVVDMTSEDKTVKLEEYGPREKWRIVKNVVVLGFAFMLHFTAYSGAVNLQSSINAEAGLGTVSLASIYAGLIFSSIFLPSVFIKWLSTKWAICLSLALYMPYIAVQPWPQFYSMVPAAILLGLGGGPLWTSKCIYIYVLSEAYSKISGISTSVLLARFLGLFFTLYRFSELWGNLISSLVLSTADNKAAVTMLNDTEISLLCGANFLPQNDAKKAFQHQPPEKIQMLGGIFLACMAGAVGIVAIGADSMKRYTSNRSGTALSGLDLLLVTFKLLVEPNQLLMIIPTIFIGFQQGFFTVDVTAAFVSCNIGAGTVGFVVMTYGMADIIGCASTAYIVKLTGRVPLIAAAGIIHTTLLIVLAAWRPHQHSGYVIFIVAVLWGLCDSVWMVQLNAYNGILFPGREEAAFANFRLWDAIGHILAYIISAYLRTRIKIYLQLTILLVGICCYFVTEYREKKKKSWDKTLELKRSIKRGVENAGFSETETTEVKDV